LKVLFYGADGLRNNKKIISLVSSILQKANIDSGFIWILINRLFSLIRGPITAFILISCLSQYEQGIWYTFTSTGALTVFAELGFTQIILQFVSQEFALLSINNGVIYGEKYLLDKFFSLIRYSFKFYLLIVPFAIIILSITGIFIFSKENFIILIAWFIYSLSGGLTLFVFLFQSIYTGLNEVANVNKVIFKYNFIIMIVTWVLLLLGVGVFSLSIGWIAGNIASLVFLYMLNSKFWKQVLFYKIEKYYSWKSEIIPLQWKYAVGFISGYFVYQLYVPVVYKVDGNILSGQLGLTLILIGVMRSISDTFMAANYPRLNMIVAQKDEKAVYSLFVRLFIYALGVNIIGGLGIIFFTKIIQYFSIGIRFLNLKLTINLVLFNIPINLIGILGLYPLLHKDGSLYPLSILAGSIGIVAMFVLYQYFDLYIIFLLFVIVYWVFLLPINVIVFFYKRRKFLYGR